MKDWVTLWFKKRWQEINFWRFYRIFTLQITSRSFDREEGLIVLGNSDSFLITYWSIFKRLFYQNHISLSMNICVNSRERALCASTWRISQSNGASNFGFSAVPSLGICINLICIWEKVRNRVWCWWISCSLSLRESKKQLLSRVLWQLFYKSKSHAKAIWGWNLHNWNRQIKPEALWIPIRKWKEVSMIGWRVIQFPQQNGWTNSQWFYCLITIIQVLSKKSTEESRVQKRKWA